jgi:hypothetical protein
MLLIFIEAVNSRKNRTVDYSPPALLAQLSSRCVPVLLLCHTRLLEASHNITVNFARKFRIHFFSHKAVSNTRHSNSSVRHNAHKFTKWKCHTLSQKRILQQHVHAKESIPRAVQLVQNLTYTSTVKWAASLSSVFSSATIQQARKTRLPDFNRSFQSLATPLHVQSLLSLSMLTFLNSCTFLQTDNFSCFNVTHSNEPPFSLSLSLSLAQCVRARARVCVKLRVGRK